MGGILLGLLVLRVCLENVRTEVIKDLLFLVGARHAVPAKPFGDLAVKAVARSGDRREQEVNTLGQSGDHKEVRVSGHRRELNLVYKLFS